MAAKIGHRRRSLVEIGVDEVAPVLGVQLRGEARRADEIAEHHRDRATLGGDFGDPRRGAVGGGDGDSAPPDPSVRPPTRVEIRIAA